MRRTRNGGGDGTQTDGRMTRSLDELNEASSMRRCHRHLLLMMLRMQLLRRQSAMCVCPLVGRPPVRNGPDGFLIIPLITETVDSVDNRTGSGNLSQTLNDRSIERTNAGINELTNA